MSCQFIHVEVYARQGARSKSGDRRHSVANILAELMRDPHACSHVGNPQPPNIIFGIHPAEAVAIAEKRAAQAIDKIGRKLRCDTPILLAGVISWPMPVSKISTDGTEHEHYEAYKNCTVEWLRNFFVENLLSCVEHMDEAFPNIHFFVVPHLRADRRMLISDVHVGLGARKSVKDAGGDRKACDRAYCEAMAAFQDNFHEQVAMKHGLLRLGPKRQRISRAEWNAQRKQALQFAKKDAEREREAAKREARLCAEMADRERGLHDKAVAAVEAMKQEMAMKAAGKARPYFEHFSRMQKELSRQLEERESLLAEKEDELAELRAWIEAHGLSVLSKKR